MWTLAAEIVSLIVLSIIIINAQGAFSLPTLQNRIFKSCLMVTFLSISTNLLSTMLISWLTPGNVLLANLVTTLYFLFTPCMGTVYFFYMISIAYEETRMFKRIFWGCSIPYIIYGIIVFTNPFNHFIFSITLNQGYIRGNGIYVTYLLFYLYCGLGTVLVALKRRQIEFKVRIVLYFFPIIAFLVILIQSFFPQYILSGSAAVSALLIIYLNLQTKRLNVDPLTGVQNRVTFLNALHFAEQRNADFVVIVISLRGFKLINDQFGQQNGDKFLASVAEVLQKIFPRGSIYRYSGDEFGVFLKNTDNAQITAYIQAVFNRFAKPFQANGYNCQINASVAIARQSELEAPLKTLLLALEYAIKKAKSDQEEGAVVCTKDMIRAIHRENQIIKAMHKKLEENDFIIYYQPTFNVHENRFTMAEALLRLYDDELGWVSPGEFIPLAEQTGLITPISYQIMHKVCAFLRRLLDKGIEIEGISVNLSIVQFLQQDLEERMLEIIRTYGIPPEKIRFELTESLLASNLNRVIAFFNEMSKYGIQFELDDFGTGYSNIAYMIDLPFSYVKLDRSLVKGSIGDDRCGLLVYTLTKAFRALAMSLIAEGVETDAEDSFVRESQCDYIQGFRYAKPMSAKRAEEYFTMPSMEDLP